jgi:hypothetical protein
MAQTVGLTDAVSALREHFGPRLQADRDGGRDSMADVLCERFGIDKDQARDLVKALEEAHSIRWVEADQPQGLAYGAPDSGYGTGIRVDEAYWQL